MPNDINSHGFINTDLSPGDLNWIFREFSPLSRDCRCSRAARTCVLHTYTVTPTKEKKKLSVDKIEDYRGSFIALVGNRTRVNRRYDEFNLYGILLLEIPSRWKSFVKVDTPRISRNFRPRKLYGVYKCVHLEPVLVISSPVQFTNIATNFNSVMKY